MFLKSAFLFTAAVAQDASIQADIAKAQSLHAEANNLIGGGSTAGGASTGKPSFLSLDADLQTKFENMESFLRIPLSDDGALSEGLLASEPLRGGNAVLAVTEARDATVAGRAAAAAQAAEANRLRENFAREVGNLGSSFLGLKAGHEEVNVSIESSHASSAFAKRQQELAASPIGSEARIVAMLAKKLGL